MARDGEQTAEPREPEPDTTAPGIPPIERRPILDFGIGLMAIVVVALVILAITESFGARLIFVPAEMNPWPAVAWLALAFCISTVVAVTIVVMRDLLVPRRIRYVCGCLAAVSLTVVATLSALACFGAGNAPATLANRSYLEALVSAPGIIWMIVAGALLGVSLPAVHDSQVERRRTGRSRRRVTMYVLWGLCISIVLYLVVWLGFPSEASAAAALADPEGPDWVAWFRDLVALPAVAYQAATLTVAVLGRFLAIAPPPRQMRPVMVAMPLVAWGAVALGGAVAGGIGLPHGAPWVVLIVCVFAGLGVAPGIVIASMRD